jgi:hypothetical protein
MSLPLEIRLYHRKLTLDDVANGVQGIRVQTGPIAWTMYRPASLQFRMRIKSGWSDWLDVPIVREDDAMPADDPESSASVASEKT